LSGRVLETSNQHSHKSPLGVWSVKIKDNKTDKELC
jgi:hypothetical protein